MTTNTCNVRQGEFRELDAHVRRTLHELDGGAVTTETLEAMRKMKNLVASQQARALMTREALDEILSDDEDMALMSFVEVNFSATTGRVRRCATKF
jgi:hypothetical protein